MQELQKVRSSCIIKVFFLKESTHYRDFVNLGATNPSTTSEQLAFCQKKTVLLDLIKNKWFGIEVVIFSKRERKYNNGYKNLIMNGKIRSSFGLHFTGSNVIWKSQRKTSLKFQIYLLFFAIGHVQISGYTNIKTVKLSFCFKPLIQIKTKYCAYALSSINNIKNNHNFIYQNCCNKHTYEAFSSHARVIWCIS